MAVKLQLCELVIPAACREHERCTVPQYNEVLVRSIVNLTQVHHYRELPSLPFETPDTELAKLQYVHSDGLLSYDAYIDGMLYTNPDSSWENPGQQP